MICHDLSPDGGWGMGGGEPHGFQGERSGDQSSPGSKVEIR